MSEVKTAQLGVARLDGDTIVITITAGGCYHSFKLTLGAAASLGGRITEALAKAAIKDR